jgi:hypothetical protein
MSDYEVTFVDFLRQVAIRKESHPEWRMGQTYFNVLDEVRPILAARVTGTSFDPFYDDGLIGSFLNYIAPQWGD